MVCVHQMVMVHQAELHHVADDVGVVRNLDAQGVFHRLHGGHGVSAGADAADAFHKSPGVAGVAPFQDDFDAAEDGSAGHRVGDDVLFVQVHLAAQMPFNAGDRVHHDAAARVNDGISLCGIFVGHEYIPQLFESLLSAAEAAPVSGAEPRA